MRNCVSNSIYDVRATSASSNVDIIFLNGNSHINFINCLFLANVDFVLLMHTSVTMCKLEYILHVFFYLIHICT